MPSLKATKLPKELSEGEETFNLQCQVHRLEPLREIELIPGRKWRFDFYFRERDLAIEIEGGTKFGKGRHSHGDGFEGDCRKYNAAAMLGIKVMRFSTAMVRSGEAINTVLAAVGRS
jgi:very-short-patch-repair endonuclease